jgi:hypothetical protein
MKKCDCYEEMRVKTPEGRLTPYVLRRCKGTKEQEECTCGGDRTKCNFYPQKRRKVTKEKPQKMQWNVFYENVNSRQIEEFNIFKHGSFAKDVEKLLKQGLSKKNFAEKLKKTVQYYFWSKAEYEVIVTSWPVYIDAEELDRINAEYEEHNEKWGCYPYVVKIDPNVGRKIDIYQQVMLNFNVFCDYVWNYKEEIK